jgi:NAD-dependent SIR2 family protein deacetylase
MKTLVAAMVEKYPRCPGCHQQIHALQGDKMPEAGDWQVCAQCYGVGRFTGEGFELRLGAPVEIEQALAAGELAEKDADFLRECFAAHAQRAGIRS